MGCLYVDSKSLRNDLLPITTNTLDRVKALLLAMARETCLQVLEDMQQRIALLQARPTLLDEFMAYQVRWWCRGGGGGGWRGGGRPGPGGVYRNVTTLKMLCLRILYVTTK